MKPLTFRFLPWAALLATLPCAAQVKDYRDLHYRALPAFQIPRPTVFTLSNGLQVFLLEDHELPLIDVSARIRTGASYEPAEKAGLASLFGAVQRSGGTTRQTGDQMDDFLAARAASIETGMGEDAGFASMDCLKPDFDDVFKAFAEVLRSPAFAQDKLDVAKVAENTMIARRNDDVGGITEREITRLVYGPDSPWARNTEYATIKAVTRDDLVAWHKKYYQPNNVLLGVSGDFDSAEMRGKIEALFGDWPAGPPFAPPPVPYRQQPAPGYYFIEKSDVNQANIAFGHLGIQTRNPDYFAVQVMNEVLSGGFASRMFSNVRSKKGLAYSVHGAVGSDFTHPGLFRAGLQTKSATMSKAIEAVKQEITGIIENPASETELKRAKDSILNSFIFHYDSKRKILAQQMTYAYYGLPADFLERYRANIEKVTTAEVARVARQYVHPDQLAILVVGKAADFDQPLANLGKVTPIDITIPPLPDSAPKTDKNAASLAAGKQAWAKIAKVMGGEALKSATALKSVGKVTLKMGDQDIEVKQTSVIVFPDKVRHLISLPMGEQTIVINGDDGFALAGGEEQPLPAGALEEEKKDRGRSIEFLLHLGDDPALEVVAAGAEKVDGVDCQVLALSYHGVTSRLWVAPDDKIAKQAYQGVHPLTRAPGEVETFPSDYRAEGPIVIPHQVALHVDGQEVLRVTIESIELNPKVDPDAFKRPTR
jgi:predicted Zn-dependent peptidase